MTRIPLLPEGNMLRFVFHRLGQDSQSLYALARHELPRLMAILPNRAALGYRPTGLNAQPSADSRKGSPDLNDRVVSMRSPMPLW